MAFPSGWQRKCGLTIQHSQVPANQTAFPVLVTEASLPSEMMTASGANAAQSDGGDIRFSSDIAGASQLACEVVIWTQNANPALAKAEIWVPVSVLTASDVTIYTWYKAGGGLTQPAANAAFGSQAVWDANFLGIWHLPNGTTPTAGDSTSNANNGTLVNSPTAVAGKIDGGINLAVASTQYVTCGNSINPSAITMSGWMKATAFTNAYAGVLGRDDGTNTYFTIILAKSNGTLAMYVKVVGGAFVSYDGTGGTLSTATWYHVAFTYSSAAGLVGYVNGGVDGTGAANGAIDTTAALFSLGRDAGVAGREFNGVLDEMRASNIARSANWITTEYNNQNAPGSFVVAGTAAAVGGFFRQSLMTGLGGGGPFFGNPVG